MHAVLEDRNSQYRVAAGDRVLIALHSELDVGSKVTFDKVFVVTGDGESGSNAQIGTPYVAGASVSATVLRNEVKGPKLIVQKLRRRKNSRRRTGFRARYTEIRIDSIDC